MASTRYDLTRDQLATVLDGEPRYRLDQLWEGMYTQLADPADITNLPKALRARLDDELPTALTSVTESVSDRGDTVKFLWELEGGSRVETVLMLYADRATVCVSSQAGCAMGCGFCATGQAGFTRHLTVGEIVEQTAVKIVHVLITRGGEVFLLIERKVALTPTPAMRMRSDCRADCEPTASQPCQSTQPNTSRTMHQRGFSTCLSWPRIQYSYSSS